MICMIKSAYSMLDNNVITWAPMSFLILGQLKELLDPEYPIGLVDLGILKMETICNTSQGWSNLTLNTIVFFPTYGLCKLAPLLGITLYVSIFKRLVITMLFKLNNEKWFVVFKIQVTKQDHQGGDIISKQLNDPERLSAALENEAIRGEVLKCWPLL